MKCEKKNYPKWIQMLLQLMEETEKKGKGKSNDTKE